MIQPSTSSKPSLQYNPTSPGTRTPRVPKTRPVAPVRTEPHPRFYADATDTVPVAVPALLRTEWWPMISFVVFKAPPEGTVHIFRPGEPMMQILIVPVELNFTLIEQTPDEQAQREVRARRIHASRETLGKDSTWTSSTDTVFDGTYRFMLRAAKEKARNG